VKAPVLLSRQEIGVGTRHNIVPSSLTAEELDAAGESKV
jgi:hypothetical protein